MLSCGKWLLVSPHSLPFSAEPPEQLLFDAAGSCWCLHLSKPLTMLRPLTGIINYLIAFANNLKRRHEIGHYASSRQF